MKASEIAAKRKEIKSFKSTVIAATVFIILFLLAAIIGGNASAQTVTYKKDTISYHQCGATTQKGTPCKIMVPAGKTYCHFHDKPKVDPAAGKTIYEGPRGGHYYLELNPDGKTYKKVYIHTSQPAIKSYEYTAKKTG